MSTEPVFSALAHPVRRQVIALPLERARTAGAIAEEFEISRSAVPEHLGVLRSADLVREKKSGGFDPDSPRHRFAFDAMGKGWRTQILPELAEGLL